MAAPGSLEALRRRNRSRVLDTVRQRGPVSRVQISRSTGLSRTTVSSLVSELLDVAVLVELSERPEPSVGRPAVLLALNPSQGGVLGIHLGHDSVRVALTDMAGGLLGIAQRDIDVDHRPADTLAYAAATAGELVAGSTVEPRRILGVGVAIAAPVQAASPTLSSPSVLHEWAGIDIAERLATATGLPVYVGNDANLGALAEWTYGIGRGIDDLVYVMLSDGVGAGLIMNGRPYRGANGTAGELGHVAVTGDGYVCRCGNRGCLETVAGTRALVGALAHTRGPDTTPADLLVLAAAGDPGAVRVIADAGRAVGRALTGVCAVLDPRLVVIGGKLAAADAPLLAGVREILDRSLPPAVSTGIRVERGGLGDNAEVLGAIALATRSTPGHLLTP